MIACKRKLQLNAGGWESLGVSPRELNLRLTLFTGQTFLWKETGPQEFTGVVQPYLVTLKQTTDDVIYMVHNEPLKKRSKPRSDDSKARVQPLDCGNQRKANGNHHDKADATHPQDDKPVIVNQVPGDPSDDSTEDSDLVYHRLDDSNPDNLDDGKPGVKQVLRDYFTLRTQLEPLWTQFSAADERFAAVAPYLEGSRMLRQNPLECVFQFICSSNNHIQRITQMVGYLAKQGTLLGRVHDQEFYSFPTLEQLSVLNEKQLRDAGFGYRAKYIIGSVGSLRSKDEGGEQWLLSLRNLSLEDAVTCLCTLPGIGPKVASCVALFSLDKHHAIPVDTHVWQIAVRYLTPELAASRLSVKLHKAVAQAFLDRFGEYAGWAHTVLFISELASHQNLLPAHLRPKSKSAKPMKSAKSTV